LVDGDKASLIRARQTVPDLFARDRVPAWLA
jgi:hypothetical protein